RVTYRLRRENRAVTVPRKEKRYELPELQEAAEIDFVRGNRHRNLRGMRWRLAGCSRTRKDCRVAASKVQRERAAVDRQGGCHSGSGAKLSRPEFGVPKMRRYHGFHQFWR